MQEDRREIAPKAFPSDSLARMFPSEWKDVWFRRRAQRDNAGAYLYECPTCRRKFSHEDIEDLHGDHIWPYSLFGETSWENYRLICANCNGRKGNFLDKNVRQVLGCGEFREKIVEYLKVCALSGRIEHRENLADLMGVDIRMRIVREEAYPELPGDEKKQ